MDIIGPFIQELFAIAGYAIVFAGVYKLYQVATDIREIKDAVIRSSHRASNQFGPAPAPKAASILPDSDSSFDSATSYAESLLRAVNAESQPSTAPVETSGPRP